MRTLVALMLFGLAINAYAGQNLFVVKKSFNKYNVFKIDAQTDRSCKLVPYASRKYIEGYWIMGEEHNQRQEMNATETKGFNKARMTYLNSDRTEMDFMPENLEKARAYFANPIIKVRTILKNGRCQIDAFMEIDNIEIKVQEIFIGLSTFLGIDYVILKGLKPDGTLFSRKYQ